MNNNVGIWIDHRKAVIVSASAGRVTVKTLESELARIPRYSGQQDGGGEKNWYEERHGQLLDQYYDEVISQLTEPDGLLIFGPGEAKLELKAAFRSLQGERWTHCRHRDDGQAHQSPDCGEGERIISGMDR